MEQERSERRKRWSCCQIGCGVAAVLFLIPVLWIGSGFIFWRHCRIPLPDGSGSIVYKARLNKILCAEWDRKVRFETSKFHGRERWVIGDPAGANPVNIYWYPATGNSGPYIKFVDPATAECYIDLKHGITLLFRTKHADGNSYAGELSSTWPKFGSTTDKQGYFLETVDGHPVKMLPKWIASKPGVYIGRIEYPYNRFVPAKISPEQKLVRER
ncbi:MAG: hypothetical protein ABFD46_07775 [Armatimonadota bacterium]